NASASASKTYQNKNWGTMQKGASLSASWLIFDFGKRFSDLSQMAAVWRATGFDYDSTVQNYVYQIVADYYSLLSADATVKANTELVTVAGGARDVAAKKFSAGSVAKADVLKADTTLAQRQLSLQQASGNREIAKGQLLSALSFPQGGEIAIADMPTTFGGAVETKAIGDLIDKAKHQRPDLLSAEESTTAAWHRRNAAFLSNLPHVSASGQLSYHLNDTIYSDPSLGIYGGGSGDRLGASVGVSVSMPIFAGFANAYNVRAQQVNYDNAKEREKAKSDAVALDVWTAYQNYKTAVGVLKQTDVLLKSAIESEKVTGGMYKVGRSTMLDWQTQQSQLADARRQNIAAKYDLYVKRASLALAVGDIQEELNTGAAAADTAAPGTDAIPADTPVK
ncbi:MAG: TolC family protein, partial [Proteobacteria bacterium]|nr:TolC family protein [Pseudomonadota bacterium]